MLSETGFPRTLKPVTRRWFTDSDMDLYIWFSGELPVRFHLVWNRQHRIQSISWATGTGFDDSRFNPLEFLLLLSGTEPLHLDNTEFSIAALADRFLCNSENIEAALADFIYARLLEYPGRAGIFRDRGTVSGSF